MLRKMPWYDWLGVVAMIGVFGQGLAKLALDGYSTGALLKIIVVPVLLGVFFWAKLKASSEATGDAAGTRGEEAPLISIVLLMREHRYLDEAILGRMIKRAWGIDIDADDDHTWIVARPPMYVIQVPQGRFLVHNHDGAYVEDPEKAAAQVSELRLRRVVLEHKAWRAVDLLGEDVDRERTYEMIGKLIAELSDDATLALCSPEKRRFVAWDDEFETTLRGPDPLKVLCLGPPAVVEVEASDPRMAAAVAEAKQRWPEFVAAFERRTPSQSFNVKVPMGTADRREFIWMEVTALEDERIIGELANDPVDLPGLRCGDRVTARLEDLNDWIYMKDGNMVGGFTVKVLMGGKEP